MHLQNVFDDLKFTWKKKEDTDKLLPPVVEQKLVEIECADKTLLTHIRFLGSGADAQVWSANYGNDSVAVKIFKPLEVARQRIVARGLDIGIYIKHKHNAETQKCKKMNELNSKNLIRMIHSFAARRLDSFPYIVLQNGGPSMGEEGTVDAMTGLEAATKLAQLCKYEIIAIDDLLDN